MNIRLASDNSLHRFGAQSKLDTRIGSTSCGIIYVDSDQRCPANKEHKIIFPTCILHTRPRKCSVCFT